MMDAKTVSWYFKKAAELEGSYDDAMVSIYYDDNQDFLFYLPFEYVVVQRSGSANEGTWDSNLALVLHITFKDGSSKFFRVDGRYQSFEGAGFENDLKEVKPIEKTCTVYRETL